MSQSYATYRMRVAADPAGHRAMRVAARDGADGHDVGMSQRGRRPVQTEEVEMGGRTPNEAKVRWAIYRVAFRVFGRTPAWPRLGFWIWR